MSRRRFIKYILLLALVLCPLCLMAQGSSSTAQQAALSDPTAVVKAFLQQLQKQTLQTDFSISILNGGERQPAGSGTIQMRDKRFIMRVLTTEAAYDGKTLYIYQDDIQELTLQTPTAEDLVSANPVLFAEALVDASQLKFSTTQRNEQYYVVDFIPTNADAGIQRFVLKLQKKDLIPVEIQVREGRQQTIIRFSNASFTTSLPHFTIDKPDAWVNDLR